MHSLLAALLALLSYSVGHRAGLQDASKLAAAAARPWAPAAAKGDAAAAGAAAQAAAAVTATKAAGDLEAAAAVTAAGRGKGGKQKEKAAAASGRASGCSLPVDFQFDVAAHSAAHPSADDVPAPLRRPGFKGDTDNPNQELYDSMWTGQHTYQRLSCWGCRFAMDVVGRLNFTTVLDAGAGNGQIVRVMRMRGKAAWGVELSRAVLERDAPDLLKAGYVEQGTLADLPFQDSQFDLVFSADVLEHIRPEEADAVISELVRVSKRHIVMSISLKSWQNDDLHSLLRPRSWWHAKFAAAGASVNEPLLWALQDKETRYSRAKGDFTECRMEGEEADGGRFEVCVVNSTWLVGRPGQEVRNTRCITPANAEVEPWLFAFTVDKEGAAGSTQQ